MGYEYKTSADDWRRRPRAKRKRVTRSCRMTLCFTDLEKAAVQEAARAAGKSIPDFIMSLLPTPGQL